MPTITMDAVNSMERFFFRQTMRIIAIVSMVSIYDLTMAAKDIGSGKNLASYLVPMLVVALFYLAIVYLLTFVIKIIERRLRAGDKR